MMMTSIGQRIKSLRKEKKYSQQFIAEKLNISQCAYSLIESAHNNVMIGHVLTLSKLYDVSTDFILKGETNLIHMNIENGFIPFINVEAVAGNLNELQGAHSQSEYDRYRIPGFKSSSNHLLFEVEGDSMTPTFYPNDILICEAQHSISDVADNSLVVIGTEKGLLTKRVKKEYGYCYLESDNKHYSPIKIENEEIKAILSIKGKVTSKVNTNTKVETDKFEHMESNLKQLEYQIERLSQQIK